MAKCLNFHAAYQCRRSGACCSAGWTIPFDAAELRTVSALRLSGRLRVTSDTASAAMIHGRCTFLGRDAEGVHACEIHRAGGHAALPLTCRMFPRLILHDPRGTFISLSHYCPTAAAMLFDAEGSAAIVDAPGPLAGSDPLDGLDARDVWPPLLRQGVMMDLDSFALWEQSTVELLTRPGVPPRGAIDAVERATIRAVSWDPGSDVTLEDALRDAFARADPSTRRERPFEPAVNRWLAARAFGTWIAYQGNGLRTIVRYLRACLDTFEVELARDGNPLEAIRRADHTIVHEASSQQLANLLNVRP